MSTRFRPKRLNKDACKLLEPGSKTGCIRTSRFSRRHAGSQLRGQDGSFQAPAAPAAAGRLSFWRFSASCGSTRGRRHTATGRPPRRGLACSTCWCAAAPCTPRRRAYSGRGRTRGGWPLAGACPWWRRCRPAAAPRCS